VKFWKIRKIICGHGKKQLSHRNATGQVIFMNAPQKVITNDSFHPGLLSGIHLVVVVVKKVETKSKDKNFKILKCQEYSGNPRK
jgi:hypothetical protein